MGRVGDDFAERWLLFLDSLAKKKKDERTRESLLCGLGFSLVSLESLQACLSQLTALNGISVSSQPLYYGAPEGTRKLKSLSVSPAKTKKSRLSK